MRREPADESIRTLTLAHYDIRRRVRHRRRPRGAHQLNLTPQRLTASAPSPMGRERSRPAAEDDLRTGAAEYAESHATLRVPVPGVLDNLRTQPADERVG
jgi:hypothetical protein